MQVAKWATDGTYAHKPKRGSVLAVARVGMTPPLLPKEIPLDTL